MINRLATLLGLDPKELSGATVDADIPLTTALINRKIAEYLARTDSKVSAAVVEPRPGNVLIVHVRLQSSLVPPLPLHLEIAGQPEWPASPVLVLRWSLAGGLGVLARVAASPILALFSVLPPGVRVDGDLIGIDIAEVLRSRDAGWLVPLVKRLRLQTSDAGVRVAVRVGL